MDWRYRIAHIVRKSLFKLVNKDFLIFLFFLALSAVFWLLMTLNETYEKEVRILFHEMNLCIQTQHFQLNSQIQMDLYQIKLDHNNYCRILCNYLDELRK